jgi:hypothetical protein
MASDVKGIGAIAQFTCFIQGGRIWKAIRFLVVHCKGKETLGRSEQEKYDISGHGLQKRLRIG